MSDVTIVPTLKSCPFCGGDAEIQRLGDRRQSTQYACTICGCTLETGEEWDHGRTWNTRQASTEDLVEALRKLELALAEIQGHADMANDVIRLKRASSGGGRVKVAVCLHHIARIARTALNKAGAL